MRKLFVITGQTGTGKTNLAVSLAQKFNGELINCDSRQIYKHLDIVTGKDKDLIRKVKIHLYDIVDPLDFFSSYQYAKKAVKVIKDILKRGKTPIVVGGTYFYVKQLLYGFDFSGKPNWELRKELERKSVQYLQNTLNSLNPRTFQAMNQSDRKNPRRLIRKIELNLSKQHQRSKLSKLLKLSQQYMIEIIGLRFKKREDLKKQIEIRVYKRIRQGVVEEIRDLLKKGRSESDPGFKTIGAKQIIDFIEGRLNKEKMIEEWITKELQYAKRQYVFMKKDKNIKWQDV